jgi:hypothetical protein
MGSPDSSSFASGTFPHKNPTLPFWRTQLHELDDHRSTEELPESCDILIIGGGYAGIAAAYHLLCGQDSSNNSRPSIVLVEARQACSGATGRNGTSNPSLPASQPFIFFRSKLIKPQVVIFVPRSTHGSSATPSNSALKPR